MSGTRTARLPTDHENGHYGALWPMVTLRCPLCRQEVTAEAEVPYALRPSGLFTCSCGLVWRIRWEFLTALLTSRGDRG